MKFDKKEIVAAVTMGKQIAEITDLLLEIDIERLKKNVAFAESDTLLNAVKGSLRTPEEKEKLMLALAEQKMILFFVQEFREQHKTLCPNCKGHRKNAKSK